MTMTSFWKNTITFYVSYSLAKNFIFPGNDKPQVTDPFSDLLFLCFSSYLCKQITHPKKEEQTRAFLSLMLITAITCYQTGNLQKIKDLFKNLFRSVYSFSS